MALNGIISHYFAFQFFLSKKRETNFVNSHSFAFLRDLFIEILSLNVIISHYNCILSHSSKKLSGCVVRFLFLIFAKKEKFILNIRLPTTILDILFWPWVFVTTFRDFAKSAPPSPLRVPCYNPHILGERCTEG